MDYLLHDVCHVAYICGHEKVGGSDAPDTELSAVLSICLTRTMLHPMTIYATLYSKGLCEQLLYNAIASFPDYPLVAYIVLTFKLAHAKITFFLRKRVLKMSIPYVYEGRVWDEANNAIGNTACKVRRFLYTRSRMCACVYMQVY